MGLKTALLFLLVTMLLPPSLCMCLSELFTRSHFVTHCSNDVPLANKALSSSLPRRSGSSSSIWQILHCSMAMRYSLYASCFIRLALFHGCWLVRPILSTSAGDAASSLCQEGRDRVWQGSPAYAKLANRWSFKERKESLSEQTSKQTTWTCKNNRAILW